MRLYSVMKLVPPIWSINVRPLETQKIHTCKFPLQFYASPILWAEPLKAKKKLDPAIIKAREERKIKKIEKMLKRRLKLERLEKPIQENTIPEALINDKKARDRKIQISNDILEERLNVLSEWSRVKLKESQSDKSLIQKLVFAQKQALNELRAESEDLYQAAVKIDETLIPFTFKGPTETPPLENYLFPDGDYVDVSKKWI